MMQLTDIALLLISSAACIYCMVLSRRLRALQNTKNGLGATIIALTDSVSAISASTRDTRQQAGELAVRLAAAIEDANQACLRLQQVSDVATARQSAALAQTDAAHRLHTADMLALITESKERITEMNTLSEQIRVLTNGTTETILQAIHRAANTTTLIQTKQASRYEQ